MSLLNPNPNNQDIHQQRLYHMYQPIYHLPTSYCHGYEALLRSTSYDPVTLFDFAIKNHQKYELDVFSVKQSIQTFFQSLRYVDCLLFVNIYPSTLIRSYLYSQLCEFKYEYVPHERIVLEINESEVIEDINQFQEIINCLKEMGYQIAMDDIGKGSSSLSIVTMVEPDIIKLDKWFSQDLWKSQEKQNYLGRMVRFCGHDVQLILEGIETFKDLETAQSLGINFAQGYFLGRPNNYLNLTCCGEKESGGAKSGRRFKSGRF